jgi:hypothetical protein
MSINFLSEVRANVPCRFYYADQREADGVPMWHGIDAEAHGEEYVKLAKDPEQEPWLYTFVRGEGYKKFEAAERT